MKSNLVVIGVLLTLPLFGQNAVTYGYDAAGNRVSRSAPGNNILSVPSEASGDTVLKKDFGPFYMPGTFSQSQSAETRPVYTEAELFERFEKELEEKHRLDSVRFSTGKASAINRTTYAVGEIPLIEGMTPSGARTYQIPIITAAGIKLAPSVAISYNSQAVEGWAGFGWDISGRSSITLIK